MSRSKKVLWKLLVLIALVSSFIFCSEVCAVEKEEKKAVQVEQIEEKKAVCTKQKDNQLKKNIYLFTKACPKKQAFLLSTFCLCDRTELKGGLSM